MLNDTLLWNLHIIIIFVVNRDNWVDSFVSVIVFIKLIKIPILSSLPLRIMNSRLSRTPLMPVALLNLFHVLHNLPNIVFVFLLYIEVSSVVVIQIVSQILKLLRRLLLIYLRQVPRHAQAFRLVHRRQVVRGAPDVFASVVLSLRLLVKVSHVRRNV
jgi:hypothetical protein